MDQELTKNQEHVAEKSALIMQNQQPYSIINDKDESIIDVQETKTVIESGCGINIDEPTVVISGTPPAVHVLKNEETKSDEKSDIVTDAGILFISVTVKLNFKFYQR